MVDSVRKNHIIESKCEKFIAVGTANKANLDPPGVDSFQEAQPSKELEVTDTKDI